MVLAQVFKADTVAGLVKNGKAVSNIDSTTFNFGDSPIPPVEGTVMSKMMEQAGVFSSHEWM